MKKFVEGKEYKLEIVNSLFETKVLFYIKALHKSSRRYSYVNNLNCILSLLQIDNNKVLVSESQWIINKREAKIFLEAIIIALNSTDFLSFLENQLDLDRLYGEWENTATI